MLRVTKSTESGTTRLKLEGKLAGCWVEVMEECWTQVLAESGSDHVAIDLNAVTYVDARGGRLLDQMHREGAGFCAATTCLAKGIVEDIKLRCQEAAKTGQ